MPNASRQPMSEFLASDDSRGPEIAYKLRIHEALRKDNLLRFLESEFIQFEFSYEMLNKKRNDLSFNKERKIIDSYHGLCHVFCELVAAVGYNDQIVKNLTSKKNHDDEIELVHRIVHKAYFIEFLNIIERILIALFKIFPKSFISKSEQNQLLQKENGIAKSINEDLLEKIIDRMECNKYMELIFLKMEKSYCTNHSTAGHATLIFKTNENGKTNYHFFDPNFGFFKSENIKEIIKIANINIISERTDYNEIGIIDINKITKRTKVGKQLIIEHLEEKSGGMEVLV